MGRASTSIICMLTLTITLGCGGSKKDGPGMFQISVGKNDPTRVAQAQSFVDDYTNTMNRSVEKLNNVVDQATAMSAAEELTKTAKRLREIAKEVDSMDKLTKTEHAQLASKGLQTAMANFSKANERVLGKIKDGSVHGEANKALQEAYLEFSKSSAELSESLKAKEF